MISEDLRVLRGANRILSEVPRFNQCPFSPVRIRRGQVFLLFEDMLDIHFHMFEASSLPQ